MPNFDAFERLMRQALAGGGAGHTAEFAALMGRIPTADRPHFSKNRSETELEGWLTRARETLTLMLPPGTNLTTTEDNAVGKDLEDLATGIAVELKSGKFKTDANPGIASIAWAFGDNDPRELHNIMTGPMRSRRAIWLSEPDFESRMRQIDASKRATMDRVHEYFQDRAGGSILASDRLSHFARSVALGLTKGKEIRSTFLARGTVYPILTMADWDQGLIKYDQAFDPDEPIAISRIERTPERAQIVLRGNRSGRTAKIYPNYKNSHHMKNGTEIPADCWVNTACFHVWVTH